MEKTATMDEIASAVATYCDTKILPNLGLSHNKMLFAGIAVSLVIKKYRIYLENMRHSEAVAMLGIFDDSGNVKIDTLKEVLVSKLSNNSFEIPIAELNKNLKIDAEDVEEVYKLLNK